MKFVGRLSLVSFLVFLSACSWWKDKTPSPPPPPPPEARYRSTELSELLRYGGELAAMTQAARTAECVRMQELAGPEPGAGEVLHILQIQTLGDSCGDRRAVLAALPAIREGLADDAVRHWLAFQEQISLRWGLKEDQCQGLEKKLRETQQTMQKSRKTVKTQESELRQLKDQMDALKSIEQNLGGAERRRKP